jgi:hypothetical protein
MRMEWTWSRRKEKVRSRRKEKVRSRRKEEGAIMNHEEGGPQLPRALAGRHDLVILLLLFCESFFPGIVACSFFALCFEPSSSC